MLWYALSSPSPTYISECWAEGKGATDQMYQPNIYTLENVITKDVKKLGGVSERNLCLKNYLFKNTK